MKVSIITINYNNAKGLRTTVISVIEQTYKDFEYIVIDGGSFDGSLDVIKQYESKIDLWLSEPDSGIYNAMNKGIKLAKGDYLLFLNAGDRFSSPRSLDLVARRNWFADIVACGIFWDYGVGNKIYIAQPRRINFQRLLTESISHQSTFIKRSLFTEKGYQEDYKIISDWIFWFEQLIIHKCTYQHINTPITIYDMSGISNNNPHLNNEERRRYLSSYFNPLILDTVISQCTWYDGLEAMRSSNGIRSVVIWVNEKLLYLNWKLLQPIVNIYYNVKYCK